MSDWLRCYQLTGQPPATSESDTELALWAGWMIAPHGRIEVRIGDRIDLAIKVAECIEERAK